MKPASDAFSRWLTEFLAKRKLKRRDFATAVGISSAVVHYYLSKSENLRRKPSLKTALDIDSKLQLTQTESESFWKSLGWDLSSRDQLKAAENLHQELRQILSSNYPSPEKEALLHSLQGKLNEWKMDFEKAVHWVAVPMGAWQHRLMSPEWGARWLNLAISEASQSGINRVIAVVRSKQQELLRETDAFKMIRSNRRLKLQFAVQEVDKTGLGNAVLTAAAQIPGNDPFAMIFPDEFTEKPSLHAMLEMHKRERKTILLLEQERSNQPQAKEERGIAIGKIVENSQHQRVSVTRVMESGHVLPELRKDEFLFRILGRYVIAPDLVEFLSTALQAAPANSGEHPPINYLTFALDKMAREGEVCGIAMELGKVYSLYSRWKELDRDSQKIEDKLRPIYSPNDDSIQPGQFTSAFHPEI
jgi:UTP-glucose-1-phosphate uridylyltransferase/predicted transcriptional regulator